MLLLTLTGKTCIAQSDNKMKEMPSVIDSEVFLAFSTYAESWSPAEYDRPKVSPGLMMELMSNKGGKSCAGSLSLSFPRCHQNDLENIIPFVVIGLLYTLTGPDLSTALLHFRVFVVSRLFHTVAYVLPLPQPSRGLAWMVGMGATFSMAYRVLSTTHL
ncbi:microsomal glutathione S-transferase 1 [Salvelinus sp. IW2-2015]|uniref:microsomal glutathione S-transferase 1 n=1 Tax=Salvelinus sp. IW2-2015 TaxID=2691554 RepID=UPI0038D419C6